MKYLLLFTGLGKWLILGSLAAFVLMCDTLSCSIGGDTWAQVQASTNPEQVECTLSHSYPPKTSLPKQEPVAKLSYSQALGVVGRSRIIDTSPWWWPF